MPQPRYADPVPYGVAGRVLRFTVPAGLIIAAATFSAYALARARGLPLTEQRTAATLVALILSLCVLALLALFPVPAMRSFYALELPHGAIGSTLLIAALGAAALAGFWVLSASTRPQTGEVTPE